MSRRRRIVLLVAAVLLGPPLVLLGLIAALAPATLGAVLRWPRPPQVVGMPVHGMARVSARSSWGSPRSGGRRHRGIDLFARRGTPVVAAADGTVTYVGLDPRGGNVVWIVGEGPAAWYYAHLDNWRMGLLPGQTVRRGDVLGYVGNTGNARTTPPHLHFGVYPLGLRGFDAVDPAPLLRSGHWMGRAAASP